LLDILLRNLVDNAIRYTPVGGQIKVRVEKKENFADFLIDDSGPGIPGDLKERVLQRFFRNVDVENQEPGSGLGLCIVDRITKLHKADLKLEDSILGGLRIRVSFLLKVV
jgi:two-component system sensor histidine kinase QseC